MQENFRCECLFHSVSSQSHLFVSLSRNQRITRDKNVTQSHESLPISLSTSTLRFSTMAVGSQSPVPSSSATTLEDLESEGDGGDGDEHDDEVENKMENEGLESEGGTMHWVDCFILNTCRKGG